jgi:LuxR family transcriptional regulator, maltose regulon positive regulatory protein
MTYQVLSTKLYIPPIQSSLVQRWRLVQHLENGYQAGKRVTLVSAPAGFGKTTVIREWITNEKLGKPFGWLSLDDGDNDAVRFLIYVVSAIQKVNSKVGQNVLTSLNSPLVPPLMDLVETLINEISFYADPFLLVLDDYHLIKKAEIHSLLQFLLKHQPDALHLVIITREDPPFPLPRMRVEGHITEIRERDLRFTMEEAQSFLVRTMGLDLSLQDISKLEERTEGWAAGMQLAALAMEDYSSEADQQTFIEAFAGSNRMIVDYLISEVLQHQSETTRKFLLRSAILERFCAELCDEVVFSDEGVGKSEFVLEDLEKSNMFLVPLDNQRHWYRYHHLFSEMLFHSLRRSDPESIPALHHKASTWFESSGLIPEAMKHALASKDWDFVKALLDRYAFQITFPGFGWMVIDWCRQILRSYVEKSPDICIHYAWALVLTFRDDYMALVDEYLQMAERAIQRSDQPEFAPVGEGGASVPFKDWVKGHICVVRSQILLGHLFENIDPQEEIALSQKGLDLLPETELISRSICRINLAHAQTMQNHPIEAQKAFEEVMAPSLESRNFLSAVAASFYMSRLAFYMQSVDRGEAVCKHWKKVIADVASSSDPDRQPVTDVPASRGLDVVQGILLLESNQLEEAERVFLQSLDMLGWGSWMELHGFVELARLRHARGNDGGVEEVLQRMRRMGPQHAACAEALDVLFDVKRTPDDPKTRARAEAWTKDHSPDLSFSLALGIGPYHRDTEYFCNLFWARIEIALGQFKQAAMFVDPALAVANERRLLFRVAELSILEALIQKGQGEPSAALESLGRALEVSESRGYTRFFNDGPELDELLQQAAERKGHAAFARQMLETFRPLRAVQNAAILTKGKMLQDGLADPLSDREMEVLRMLAEGIAPAEVAKKLYVSPFTLKAHTQNIYSKLNVHSRIEAINRARELKLL